jgi:ATP-binding cassette, subfamily C (CFTR/MRP), member 1
VNEVQPEKKKKKKKKAVDGDPTKPKKKKKVKKVKTGSESNLTESLLAGSQKSKSDTSSIASSASSSSAAVQNIEIPRLSIHRGQFVSVIGRVGSGKTTFLYSILGEIDRQRGTLSRRGTVAYIPQTSWLRSSTIRDNILFESPFDEARYNHIIKIC